MSDNFHIKFQTNSAKVNAISFHPRRPWILAALQNGIIQLWDYRSGVLHKTFKGHVAAVRGVCFHNEKSMFVSGGDDSKITVWDYEQSHSDFTLYEHSGIIRSTFFHNKYPWIISASDDNTARVWDWKSRTFIARLLGHVDRVTCAQFHPVHPIAITGSLDKTNIIFNLVRLDNKPPSFLECIKFRYTRQMTEKPENEVINWVAINHQCYASASGDKIIVKRYEKEKEGLPASFSSINTHRILIGEHGKSYLSVLFHPNDPNLILACSEDKSIEVWDIDLNKTKYVFRHNNERFSNIAAHPNLNIFAAGHDNGLIIFKIEKDRVPYCIHNNFAFYVKNQRLRKLDLSNGNDSIVCKLLDSESYHSISFRPGSFDFLILSRIKDSNKFNYFHYYYQKENCEELVYMPGKNPTLAAFWFTEKYAVLEEDQKIFLVGPKNMENRVSAYSFGFGIHFDNIFFAGTNILLRNENGLYLSKTEIMVPELTTPLNVTDVRYVVWNESVENAALLTKNSVTLVNKYCENLVPKLRLLCSKSETDGIKSGVWDEKNGVFIYNTRNQIKFLHHSGDSGIIKSLICPLYIMAVRESILHCLDKTRTPVQISIDSSDYKLKLALISGKIDEVSYFTKRSKIASYSRYLGCRKNDEKTRLCLAVENGNFEIALECAEKLNDVGIWEGLGEAALIQGNHQIAEICYQRSNNYEKLLFLYLVTGNSVKLEKMMRNAEHRNDENAHFEAALLIGDVRERIKILKNCGQISLGYLTSATHGYINEANQFKNKLESKGLPLPEIDPNARFLAPPLPIVQIKENWPKASFKIDERV